MPGVLGDIILKRIFVTYLWVVVHHHAARIGGNSTWCTTPLQQTGSIQLYFHASPVSEHGGSEIQTWSVRLAWNLQVVLPLSRLWKLVGRCSSFCTGEPWQLSQSQIISLTEGLKHAYILLLIGCNVLKRACSLYLPHSRLLETESLL